MKLIIAGTRDLGMRIGVEEVNLAVADFGLLARITEVVSGCASGVDAAAEQWAKHAGIPVVKFSADWDRWGKSAGPIRNKVMAEYADELLAMPRNESVGTKDMIRQMHKFGKPVHVYPIID